MKRFFILVLTFAITACAVFGSTPEAQIVQGAQAHTAASNLAANLLQRNKITVAQAQSYRAMLGTASAALDGSAATLRACRITSGLTVATPDPCQQTVSADVGLALAVLTEIEKTLQAQAAK